MRYSLLYILTILSLIFQGCNDELEPNSQNSTLSESRGIYAELMLDGFANGIPNTRFSEREQDGWTWSGGLVNGDTVGMFARKGNPYINNGAGPIINLPMFYSSVSYVTNQGEVRSTTSVVNPNFEMDLTAITYEYTIAFYYPYTELMGSEENYDPVTGIMDPDKGPMPGLELRVRDDDGILKCRNFYFTHGVNLSWLQKRVLVATLSPKNCELIIMRGEGFDNPIDEEGNPNYDIWVGLNFAATHVRIADYGGVGSAFNNQIYYQPGYSIEGKEMSEEDAKRWQAWSGAPQVVNGETYPAYYVSLPVPTYSYNKTGVQASQNTTIPSIMYVEMYDNDGRKQKVSSIELKENKNSVSHKTVSAAWQYPFIVQTTELGATLSQVQIDNWDKDGDDKNITDEREAGIHDASEYNDWAELYNSYNDPVNSNQKDQLYERLKHYGDNIDGIWYFYINNDIRFSADEAPTTVSNLQDVIQGSNNFNYFSISNVYDNYPLFLEISGNGVVQNLSFNNFYITPMDNAATGCIAQRIIGSQEESNRSGGIIRNCRIVSSTVSSSGPVGMLAGEMNGGEIDHCTFSGFLQGSSTATGLFQNVLGITPTTDPLNDPSNNFSNIIFSTTLSNP